MQRINLVMGRDIYEDKKDEMTIGRVWVLTSERDGTTLYTIDKVCVQPKKVTVTLSAF